MKAEKLNMDIDPTNRGLRNVPSIDETTNCCELMYCFLKKEFGYRTEIEINYSHILREHSIGSQFRQAINNCPWCGTKLPASLRIEYRNILEQEHGIKPDLYTVHLDKCNNPKTDQELRETLNVPDEFKTDKWWKERGL